MALMTWLNGCLLLLLDPHTPINTRPVYSAKDTKKHTEKIEKRKNRGFGDTLPTNPPKVISIFIQAKAAIPHSELQIKAPLFGKKNLISNSFDL